MAVVRLRAAGRTRSAPTTVRGTRGGGPPALLLLLGRLPRRRSLLLLLRRLGLPGLGRLLMLLPPAPTASALSPRAAVLVLLFGAIQGKPLKGRAAMLELLAQPLSTQGAGAFPQEHVGEGVVVCESTAGDMPPLVSFRTTEG